MISLRVSDQEYQELKRRCVGLGDFNVSEFIRAAMVNALNSADLGSPPTYLELKVATLFSRLERLEQRLAGMSQHDREDSSHSELAHLNTE